MNAVLNYFDLSNKPDSLATRSNASKMPVWEQVLLYVTMVVAVVLSKGIAQARAGTLIDLNLSWGWVVVAALIALVTFEAVWKRLGARADSTLLVRMSVAAQGGAFWAVLLTAAENAVTPPAGG